MNAHWWKAWVLLAGLGATVLGMLLPPDEQPPANSTGLSQTSTSVEDAPVLRVVFRSPLTRTRRS